MSDQTIHNVTSLDWVVIDWIGENRAVSASGLTWLEWHEELHELRAERDALAAELARLRRLEAALPKTADGVPITQGMTVYVVGYREEPVEVACEEMRLYEGGDWWLDGSGVYPSWQPQFCYSTLEAARNGGA